MRNFFPADNEFRQSIGCIDVGPSQSCHGPKRPETWSDASLAQAVALVVGWNVRLLWWQFAGDESGAAWPWNSLIASPGINLELWWKRGQPRGIEEFRDALRSVQQTECPRDRFVWTGSPGSNWDRPFQSRCRPAPRKGSGTGPGCGAVQVSAILGQSGRAVRSHEGNRCGNGETTRIFNYKKILSKINTIDHVRKAFMKYNNL